MNRLQTASLVDKIAKTIVGAIAIVRISREDFGVFNGNWPKMLAFKKGIDIYEVHLFRSPQAIERAIYNLSQDDMAKFLQEQRYGGRFIIDETTSKKDIMHFLKHRIEMSAKYGLMQELKDHPIEKSLALEKTFEIKSKQEMYDLLIGEYKIHHIVFEKMFGPYSPQGEGRFSSLKHKNWEITIDSKANQDADEIKALLDEVESHLSRKSFGNLAYGKVMVTDKLNMAKKLADYQAQSDILRIAGNKRVMDSRLFVKSILHELGHRNWAKSLGPAKKAEVASRYMEYTHKEPEIKLQPGDVIVEKAPKSRYVVEKVGYNYLVGLLIESQSKRMQGKLQQKFRIPFKGLMYDFFEVEKGQPLSRDDNTSSFLPTLYSHHDYEEMYAELFSIWLFEGLKEPAQTWFENLHK